MKMWRGREIIGIEQSLNKIVLKQPSIYFVSSRYIFLLVEYNNRARQYSIAYHTMRGVISIGSLIVPALLSVQYTNGAEVIATQLYWIVWALSLLVTISNGIMQLVKIDKKYFTLNTIYHQLVSEGWQFIQLTGKYSGSFTPGIPPTHENQYLYFTSSIEKIRMKQVEEEYYKVIEQANQQADQLVPPTPAKPLLPLTQNSTQVVNGQETAIQRKNPTQIPDPLSFKEQALFFSTNPLTPTGPRGITTNSLSPTRG
jgi:hypothetical protein